MIIKQCIQCHKFLELSCFSKSGNKNDKTRNKCRSCSSKYHAYWLNKPDNRKRRTLDEQKRQARKISLPDTLTNSQWEFAVKFFDNKCAYCGQRCDKLQIEHFIPLNSKSCTGTIPQNIVPSCPSCNAAKCDNDPIKWVKSNCSNSGDVLNKISTLFSVYATAKIPFRLLPYGGMLLQ